MSVFKLSYKILRQNQWSLLIYLVIFLVMTLIIVGSGRKDPGGGYYQSQPPIALQTSSSSALMDGLKRELVKTTRMVDIPPGESGRRDAMFFGTVRYVLDWTQGFSTAFMRGDRPRLTRYARPDDQVGLYLDMAVDQYFRLADLYRAQLPGLSEVELVEHVGRSLEREVRVVSRVSEGLQRSMPYAKVYFNFMSYSLFNLLILGICALMLVFNQWDIRMRHAGSPLRLRTLNGQLFTAVMAYSLICWAVMSLLCLLLQSDSLPLASATLFLLNGLVFTVCAAAISFAIGQLTENREALSGMATVITLASSFLGGAFVPQELLGAGILRFAQYLPSYWYVRANGLIADSPSPGGEALFALLGPLGMQLLFALAFFSLALLISRKKRRLA